MTMKTRFTMATRISPITIASGHGERRLAAAWRGGAAPRGEAAPFPDATESVMRVVLHFAGLEGGVQDLVAGGGIHAHAEVQRTLIRVLGRHADDERHDLPLGGGERYLRGIHLRVAQAI